MGAATLAGIAANAVITTPTEGQVIRGGTFPISESEGAHRLNRDGSIYNATTNPGGGSTAPNASGAACGNRTTIFFGTTPISNPPVNPTGAPYGMITIKDPNNVVVFTATSPEKVISQSTVSGFTITTYNKEGPYTVNYTIPDTSTPGVYTIESSAFDSRRNATGTGCTAQPKRVIDVKHFEFRPWQQKFTDIFGNGSVSFNLFPPEFQAALRTVQGPITGGATTMHQYSLNDGSSFVVPADPAGCANNPTSCLPVGAAECTPGDAACEVRVVTINWSNATQTVYGVFDLETRAFIAQVKIGGNNMATLFSLGTENDAVFRDLLAQLAAQAAAQGIDLMSLLATKVRVTLQDGGPATIIEVSLLQGLQMYEQFPAGPTGISIIAPITATIGLFAHSYPAQTVPNPTGVAGDTVGCSTVRASDGKCIAAQPAATTQTVGRYSSRSGYGYNVLKSDLLPDLPVLPAVPPVPPVPGAPVSPATVTGLLGTVGALTPTKFFNVYGKWNTGSHAVNAGVDTNPGEPHGLPVWINPLSGLAVPADPTNTTALLTAVLLGVLLPPAFPDHAMDFLGTASWTARENCTATTCSVSGSMRGLGVAIFSDKPLPVGFRDLPLWASNPEAAAIIAQINQAIADGVTEGNAQVAAILADPNVQMVIAAIYEALGMAPPVPEAPPLPA